MTHTEFSGLLETLGLRDNLSKAARMLGVDKRTIYKWILNERGIPEPVARLVRFLVLTGTTADSFMETLSIEPEEAPT